MQTSTNKYLLLAITMVANFFNPFTGSAVNIALPQLAAELNLHVGAMSWVTMAYLLASAAFLVPMGKIGDHWGRRTIFLWGSVVFMLASFACALTVNAAGLISFRLLQGLGGAMMVSVSMAILMAAFEPGERGLMIGLNVASVYLGLSAAPVLGGLLTDYWGWRSLFYINGAVSIFVTIALFFAIRPEKRQPATTPFDWKGASWYVISLLLLMYGLSRLPQPLALVSVLAGRLSTRFAPAGLSSVGMMISVVGLLLMAFLNETSPQAYILTALAVLGVGFGLFSSPNTNVVMSSVDQSNYGVASATLATMRNLGMVFSMAVATLAVHVFIGDKVIGSETLTSYLHASRLVFFLFAGFCAAGVFTSMKRM